MELLFFGTVEEDDQSSVNNSIDVGFCSVSERNCLFTKARKLREAFVDR